MLACLLLTISKHNPLQSKSLRISNGRRGGRQALDVKKKNTFFSLAGWLGLRPQPTCQGLFHSINRKDAVKTKTLECTSCNIGSSDASEFFLASQILEWLFGSHNVVVNIIVHVFNTIVFFGAI